MKRVKIASTLMAALSPLAKWLPGLPQFEVGETVDVADTSRTRRGHVADAGEALSSVFGIVVIVVLLGLGFSGLGLGFLGLGIVLNLLLGLLHLTQGLPLRDKLVSLCHIICNNHLGIESVQEIRIFGATFEKHKAFGMVQRDLTIVTFYVQCPNYSILI